MSVMPKINSTRLFSDVNFVSHIKYEHLIAGVSGGVISTLVLHPLDIIKLRFAANDGRLPQYRGVANALTTIYREEGFRGLYQGVIPNVVGAGTAWGFYFFLYHSVKTWIQDGDINYKLSPGLHLLAASEAGIVTLFITNPIWVVKTRMCLQYNTDTYKYKGMLDALVKIYKLDGIRGYYKGLVPGLFGVSHGAVQFMTYDEMKNRYNLYYDKPISSKLGTTEYIIFAAISKLIASGGTYPYQVIRARLQNQHYCLKGTVDCIVKTWTGEGWHGFYKGLSSSLLRVIPSTMITFVIYEKLSQLIAL